jgi:hypothetical protein
VYWSALIFRYIALLRLCIPATPHALSVANNAVGQMRVLTTIFFFLTVNFQNVTENCFMATLKPNEKQIDTMINGERIFSISPGQVFLYDYRNHHAYRQDGKMGYIEPYRIIKTDKTDVFKFKYADELFKYSDDNELIDLGLRYKVDFRSLITRIRKKDSKSFKEYLRHEDKMDGAAAEIYYGTFWRLINDWTDKELYNLIESSDSQTRKQLIQIMLAPETTWPIENQRQYYKKYYPTTFQRFIKNG